MTADIVNLRQARKAQARAAGEKRAEENRAKFGRTKRERKDEAANEALRTARLQAHEREAMSNDAGKTADDDAS
jgi:hypothetical protein